jgi:hypothetical protein
MDLSAVQPMWADQLRMISALCKACAAWSRTRARPEGESTPLSAALIRIQVLVASSERYERDGLAA